MLLRLAGVSKAFGGVTAVRNVDLSVDSGEILGLIGPNGSGKTTLFNVITGFFRPDSGRVLLNDREITGAAPARPPPRGAPRAPRRGPPSPPLPGRERGAVPPASGHFRGHGEVEEGA